MDYRRNEDKLAYRAAKNNVLHLVENISEDSGPVTEPVTVLEVKQYLRLEGFQADDDSPADEFDYDDSLIEAMITEAREFVEANTGLHLVPKRLFVVLSNGKGLSKLPGPVTGDITATDQYGVAITIEKIGTEFPKILTPNYALMKFTYDAGYTAAPEWAKRAIKAYIADHYEYRGDDAPPAANVRVMQILRPHRQLSAWA